MRFKWLWNHNGVAFWKQFKKKSYHVGILRLIIVLVTMVIDYVDVSFAINWLNSLTEILSESKRIGLQKPV